MCVVRGGLLVLEETQECFVVVVVSGAERWQNGPDVTVDYSLTDPLTRWDSYQNICNGEGRASHQSPHAHKQQCPGHTYININTFTYIYMHSVS